MSAPIAESYVCPSGGVIAGGQYVAPSISGTVWTPDRDIAGDVLDGNWLGLPLNTWLDVDGQVMNDVIETSHLLNSSSGDSSTGIINAWGGAAWDYTNQRMYIAGGGHGDSSARETGIYRLDAAQLAFARVHDRATLAQLQSWNTSTHALDAAEHWNSFNSPLANGVPGSWHTYHGLLWIPPSVMGNTSGGIFYPGAAKAVWDIDANTWSTCFWNNADHDATDWSDCAAFIDGSKIYGPRANFYHYRFDLTQTESTDWSGSSLGAFSGGYATSATQMNVGSSLWAWLRERREEFCFSASGVRSRIRYGAALDAAATDWSSYSDTITLTSSDGSHSDFDATNLATGALLGAAGAAYDHATETIYVQGNTSGGQLYTITGLSGNTWTTEKIDGTGALRAASNGTYGRLRMAVLASKKFLLRVSGTTHPIQVMRLT